MDQPNLGLYGKIPAHGDFIDRQLPVSFIRNWDEWLQVAIANSKERLGENWLDLYLTSPIWRFMLSAGTLNELSWAGILVPSVDSVGRYFPLTIAIPLPTTCGLTTFCLQNDSWFQAIEAAALDTLQDGLNADQLSERLLQIPSNQLNMRGSYNQGNNAVQSGQLDLAIARHMDSLASSSSDSFSLWQSVYSEPTLHNLVLAQSMPTADQFTALIDGQWPQWGWGLTLLNE